MSAGMIMFDDGARKALLQSHVEAEEALQSKITELHMLIALVKDEGPVGKILAGQGVKLERIQRLVDEATPSEEKSARIGGKIDLDVSIQRVLEQATGIAHQKKSMVIGVEHLLFALVKNPGSRLKTVMDTIGLDRSQILAQLEPLLAKQPVQYELPDLLATLEACRDLLQGDAEAQSRISRIEGILREYFSGK